MVECRFIKVIARALGSVVFWAYPLPPTNMTNFMDNPIKGVIILSKRKAGIAYSVVT